LERELREVGRVVVQEVFQQVALPRVTDPIGRITFQGQTYRINGCAWTDIDTRFGTVKVLRRFYQNTQSNKPGLAPLEVQLGLFGGRATPALSEVTGRLAADMPQQAVIDMLEERFAVRPGVGTVRRWVADLSSRVRAQHDEAAVEQLLDWFATAQKSLGKQEILFQVGRDGVFVPTRPCWEEASCGTLAVFDRQGERLGTIYMGQMPEAHQTTMTSRLTKVITAVLKRLDTFVPKLRYITDAGSHAQAFYHDVLKDMKHPTTDEPLKWTWGVDFYHACEYVSDLANTLFGAGTAEANNWARVQRHILRDEAGGVSRVIRGAAQQKRRHGLQGSESDFTTALNYLKKYSQYMDYAAKRADDQPIGSGITEAGCKVIFGQRFKQSGMRWKRASGQLIVDLRTAIRSRLWNRIWKTIINDLPDINPVSQSQNAFFQRKIALPG
jgi:hypothetical protein